VSASLPFTGERFTPEIGGAIWYEHWHRYCALLPAVVGKRVLDAACGEGYGSMLLAGVAAEVTGVDIDDVTIRHAAARYGGRRNLRFVQGSCIALPLASESIDLVVSFETIEHLTEQHALLAELRRVLAPEGVLVVSSPNRPVYSELGAGGRNEYHVRELTREELKAMLDAPFPQQAWYAQRVLAHSMLWAEDQMRPPGAVELLALSGERVHSLAVPAPPAYFVVVCGGPGASLPRLPALSIFDDGAQSLVREYERAVLAEKHHHYDLLDAHKIAEERLDQAIAAVNDLASSSEREKILRSRVASLEAALTEAERAAAALAETEARLRFRESWEGWWRWPLGRLRQFTRRAREPAAAGGPSR
jgi:ubiquinone/menaquinone biosynthesis C-methylase UbiE